MSKKVALGLSGGVDSAVSLHLLLEQGYDVTAIYLECWNEPGCRAEQDKKDALQIALKFNTPFKTIDLRKAYKTRVMDYFFNEYKKGHTPNPDVLCNSEIKFGLFYDWAMEHDFEYIATGHYSRISNIRYPISAFHLCIPKDKHKDQTYFLHQVRGKQLEHVLFPLADLSKDEVRRKAEELKLQVANKKDSVGICFVGDVNVKEMIKEKLGENPGEVVDSEANVIGKHKGLWFYTIGQRQGFTVDHSTLVKQSDGTVITKHNIPPFYVVDKKPKENQLVVGFGKEGAKNNFLLAHTHWIHEEYMSQVIQSDKLLVRIRHTGDLLACQLFKQDDEYRVELELAEKGIAAGQFAVFYLPVGEEIICLGGGTVSK